MKKILSLMICLMSIISLCSLAFSASAAPAGIAINNAEEFMAMISTPVDAEGITARYYLMSDITLPGTYAEPFWGILDGNGKTITVTNPIFADFSGEVKNLTIKGDIYYTDADAAAFAVTSSRGYVATKVTNNANVTVFGHGKHVGGFSARIVNNTTLGVPAECWFIDCVNNGRIYIDSIADEKMRAGGFAGIIDTCSFSNCINNGDIYAKGNTCIAGGLVARVALNMGTNVAGAFDCVNNGNIKVEDTYKDKIGADHMGSAAAYAGGIFGYIGTSGNVGWYRIWGCINNGNIDAPYRVGGISGYAYSSGSSQYIDVQFCINTGDIIYGRLSDVKEGIICYDYASPFVAYANSPFTTIKYCIDTGSLVKRENAISANDGQAFIGLSSADGAMYDIRGVYVLNKEQYKWTTWAYDDKNAANRHSIEEAEGIIVTTREDIRSGKVAYLINTEAKNDPYGWAGDDTDQPYFFYQTIGVDHFPTSDFTHGMVISNNGGYSNLNPADCEHTTTRRVYENILPATCTVPGSQDEVVYCLACSKELLRRACEIPASHNYEGKVIKPTVFAGGSTLYTCSVCFDSYSADFVPPLAPVPGDINGDGTATILDAIYMYLYLSGEDVECVASTLDANGDKVIDEKDAKAIAKSTVGDVTVSMGNICEHNLQFVPSASVTADKHGYSVDHWACTICKMCFTDETAKCAVAQDSVTIHLNEWVTEIPSTKTTDGSEKRVCSICGKILERRVLHATGSEGLVFELSSDGKYYSLVGTGTCTDTDLYIPSYYNGLPVTTIPEWASISNDIVSLHIPETITTIEYDGWDQNLNAVYITDLFAWCNINFRSSWSTPLHTANNLYINGELVTTLLIPEGVKYIKFAAFAGCENITTVVLPESVYEIAGYAFESCSALTSVYIPKNVVYISSSALINAEALTSINIAPDNQYYDFKNGCLIEKYSKSLVWGNHNSIIPADGSVTEIASNAFYACTKLTEITIPGTVKRIGYDAFSDCSNLASLTIGDGVETIGAWAFSECIGLRNVTIPDSVTKIEDHVFYNCGNIDNFTFDGSPTKWEAVQKGKWWNAYSDFTVVCTKAEDGHRHVISEWITDKVAGKLENGLRHQECVICKEVMNTEVIPATGSVGLEFKLSEDGEQYILVGLGTCTDAEIGIPSVYNNKPVTIIARNAFNSDVVTSVLIPASITCIEDYAFGNCKNLVAVHISDLKAWCNVDFYSYLANPLYFANNLYLNGELVTELVIPDGVTSLDRTFAGCKNITSVVCPESLIYLGYHTFMDCSKLTSVYIPKNVSYIEGAAFLRCELLENINIDPANTYFCFKDGCLISIDEKSLVWGNHNSIIPSDGSVTRIASSAFADCTKLTSIIIPDSVEIIDYNAFSGCSNLENVIIGSGVKGICSSAFASCSSLGKIVLPAGLEIIEDWVFVDCTSLTSVTIPNSVKSIGWYTFDNCGKLTTVIFDGTATEWSAVTKADDWYGNCDFEVVFTKGEDGHTHDIIVIEAVKPSCTTTGLTEGSKCSICGYVLVAQEVLHALGHTEGEWVVDKAPTKTEEGSKHTNCTVCGAEFKAYIQPIASEGLVYTINEDGQSYTLSGMGTCTDTNVVIAGEYEGLPVTTVAEDVFNNYTTLESLYIPASITSFEWSGFWNCPNFTKVMISDLTAWCGISFGINPLECAENLYLNGELVTNLVIPEGVTRIGYSAFSGARIESVVLPESLEAIGGFAFSQCYNLKEIAIPKNVYEIGGAAFFYCPIDTISVDPDNKTFKVVNNCLINADNKTLICGYGDCVIPNDGSIARIANRAFAGNDNLTQMVIPEGVTHLDMYAFLGCSNLTTVIVPNSIKTISYGTFSWCENIKTFIFDGSEAEWNNVSKYSDWNANCTFTVQFMVAADGHRHDQTKVEGKAPTCTESGLTEGLKCSACGLIFCEQTVVPATGHTEGEWVVDKAPTNTEDGVKKSTCTVCGAEFTASIPWLGSEGLEFVLSDDGKYYILTGFGTCTDTEVYIPSIYNDIPVTTIAESASFPPTVVALHIPASISSVGNMGIVMGRDDVYIYDLAAWCNISCNRASYSSYDSYNLYLNGQLVTDLVIPEGVKRINNYAFMKCGSIKSVTIPKSISYIYGSVLSAWISLETVNVDAVKEKYSFIDGCLIDKENKTLIWGNADAVIPSDGSVTRIGDSAFNERKSLTSITIPNGVTSISSSAFNRCNDLTTVIIPNSVTNIGSWAFAWSTNLTNIIFDGTSAEWEAITKGNDWNSGCNFTVSFTVGEDGHRHDVTAIEAVKPTCTATGLTEGLKCSACGLIFVKQATINATGHSLGNGVCEICGIVLVIPEEYVDATPGYITTEDTVITTTHLMFEVPKNVYVMDNFVENVNLVTKIMERVSGMKFEGNPKYCDRTGNKTHAKVTVVKPEGSECGPAFAAFDGGAVISACDIVDFFALIHENSHVLQYRQSGWAFCTWAMESISTYTTYKTVKYILENYPELTLMAGTPNQSIMNYGIYDYGKLYEHTMEYWMENTFEYSGNNNYSIGFRFAWFLDEVYGDYTKWIYVYEESRPYHSADASNTLPVEEQAKAFKMAYGENVFDEFYAWLKQNEYKFDVSSVTDLSAEDQMNLYPKFMADEMYSISGILMYDNLCFDLKGGMYYLETYQNKNIDSLVLRIHTQSPSSLLLFDAEGKCIRSEKIDSLTEIDISGVYYIILSGTGVLNWFEIIGF